MGRSRVYDSNAERQAAYRARVAARLALAGTDQLAGRRADLERQLADSHARTAQAETRAARAEARAARAEQRAAAEAA